ncbi:hypothetical protein [Cellulosimicrobium sp. NPDC057127]|uniref:hypothetical protein n=1 Tax=Cellulosimicrobium sp. NPDC057127 TaxID=3346026 RepID=UPI003639B219
MSPTARPAGDRPGRHPEPHRVDRRVRAAVASVLVPPVAWAVALGASYAVQDFACTAYASAGAPAPDAAVGAVVLALDAVLLLLTVAAGVVALRALRRARATDDDLLRFLGALGLALAVGFGAGIVLIAVNPLVLEVCA